MVGVLLAVVIFALSFAAHLIYSHVVHFKDKEPVLVRFMAAASIGYVVVYAAAAALPAMGDPVVGRFVDFATGLCAMGFFVLGYVEFWSLIERSFSLRILIDLADANRALGLDDIARNYSGGRGLKWMMDKRTTDLIGSGTLRLDTRRGYRLTIRGRFVALAFCALHRAFCIRIE